MPRRTRTYQSIANTNPVVTITSATTATAGAPVSLSSSISDATSGKTYTYSWSVTQPGNSSFVLPDGSTTNQPNFIFTPPTPGSYAVVLTVTDNLGGSGSATLSLTATAPGPGVIISGTDGHPAPASVTAGTALNLTSIVTEPTGATPTDYVWLVTLNGDAYPVANASGSSFTFTPTINGLYSVSLSVIDSDGGTSSTSIYLSVTGGTTAAAPQPVAPPTVTATPPATPTVPPIASEPPAPTEPSPGQTASPTVPSGSNLDVGTVPTYPTVPSGSGSTGTTTTSPTVPSGSGSTVTVATPGTPDVPPSTTATPPAPSAGAGTVATVAISGAPMNAVLGTTYPLTGSADTTGLTLTWTVLNQTTGQTATATGATFAYKPLAAGTEIITLSAVEGMGHTVASTSVTVSVTGTLTVNLAPPGQLQPYVSDMVQATVQNALTGVSYSFSWSVTGQGNVSYAASGPGSPIGATGSRFSFEPQTTGAIR